MRGLLAASLMIFVLCACSEEEEKFIEPPTEDCQHRSIENQYILHFNSGKIKLANRKPFLHEESWKDLKWYEPNYRIVPQSEFWNRNVIPRDNLPIWNHLGVFELWNKGYKGQNISIAVVDSGVNMEASFIEGRWYRNLKESVVFNLEAEEEVDDDKNGYVDDILGWNFNKNQAEQIDELNHGTQIVHLIAGGGLSPIGRGIAPESLILPVDFMDENGGDELHAMQSIEYALQRKVKIINNSWITPCSTLLRNAFSEWSKKDVLIVNAAGNQGYEMSRSENVSSNILGDNLIGVGALNEFENRASFSNYGANIKLFAPGTGIATFATVDATIEIFESSGTSFSAAIVSGAAALLWSQYPDWNAVQIKNELIKRSLKKAKQDVYLLRLQSY